MKNMISIDDLDENEIYVHIFKTYRENRFLGYNYFSSAVQHTLLFFENKDNYFRYVLLNNDFNQPGYYDEAFDLNFDKNLINFCKFNDENLENYIIIVKNYIKQRCLLEKLN